jgi:hypothetical protein
MQRIFLLLLVLVCAAASAQVFRQTGPDGQVHFSDRPGKDAEQIDIAPTQTFSPPPVPARTGGGDSNGQNDATSLYSEFTIVSPVSGQEVRANDGNVTVRLSLQPELMSGHTMVLNIDGEDGEKTTTGDNMTIELSNLSRGRHTVEATVVGEDGKELIQAGPISFNVLRTAVGGG